MVNITKSTPTLKAAQITRNWHLIDMNSKTLGREVNKIASLLQGKHKVMFSPNLDNGDHVVVINAEKVVVTGKKPSQKVYTYFSGYPGGLREVTFKELLAKNPVEVIRHAVVGMLPKNKLRDRRMARLHIHAGEHHSFNDKFNKES